MAGSFVDRVISDGHVFPVPQTVLSAFVVALLSQWGCSAGATNEQNTQEVRTRHSLSWTEAEYTVWLGGEAPHGTLRLTAGRYAYEGRTGRDTIRPFYFVQHPAGELSFEENSNARATVGLLHFDPLGPDYNPSDPRRTLEVRRTDSGGFEMHSIVSEFQRWRIATP